MADETAVNELERACNKIAELLSYKSKFISRPEWGAINFENARNDIETVFWIVEEIKTLPNYILPQETVQKAVQHLISIHNVMIEIYRFEISQGDPSSLRDDLSNELKQELQATLSTIGIWLPLLALRAGEIENWAAKMKETSAEVTGILQDTTAHAETQKAEIEKISEAARGAAGEAGAAAEAARGAAGEAGAAEFTHEFRTEAEIVERRGRIWLLPTCIFSVAALLLASATMFGLFGDTPDNVWEAVYELGGRVVAISVLFYAAVWSGRIVLANMHLASVNKHRAVSLQTLQAFHRAAEDGAAKDAVVLEAARAVYENVPSGYIAKQAAEGGSGMRTIELIRNARMSQTGDGS